MKQSQVKVVQHRPLMRALGIALVGGLGIVLAVVGYQLGSHYTEKRLAEVSEIEHAYEAAQERAEELQRRLADFELGVSVDGDAQEQLRQTIKGLRDELAEGREELRFYRQLMAPSAAERGLRVERLDLTRREGAPAVDYRLLLTQVVDRQEWISGKVTVTVIGQVADSEQVLSLTDLAAVDPYPLSFKFRYFQDFTGSLTLPDGFVPASVNVAAETSGRGAKRVERTFAWMVEEG